jgi:hypothetical protein
MEVRFWNQGRKTVLSKRTNANPRFKKIIPFTINFPLKGMLIVDTLRASLL